ncbi:hypothetical protein Tdes44962_MAKER08877 [Teratosphaeria destructans]|uniref:Uncharacterized protein n=1 Tax=Teratosphaeria destructans TaxID=418781 RepID=A0A9W7SVL2_9PEZI|nr:hypothetical protein Tdes44962_MAKER08877 [Teratosphaeria destructans]
MPSTVDVTLIAIALPRLTTAIAATEKVSGMETMLNNGKAIGAPSNQTVSTTLLGTDADAV